MLSNRVLFGIVCLAAAGCTGLPDRSAVNDGQGWKGASVDWISADTGGKDREVRGNKQLAEVQAARVVRAAQAEIGVRESGENTGKRVDGYNAYVGLHKAPWCASFVSFCFAQAGFAEPRTAWSPALFPGKRLLARPGPGAVLGIYYPSKKRIAHCGIVTHIDGDWCYSVEGNTNDDGGREGNGVYAKRRHVRTIHRFADWISK